VRTSLVLTVIGTDRPGIVERISDEVLAAGANWEESSMARLAGKFAGLLRVSVDAERADDLSAKLQTLGADGLTVVVERSSDMDAAAVRTLSLDLVGNDRPGIVRDISHVLASNGVNIEELETDVTSAAMSGEPVFRARIRVRLPDRTNVNEIRRILESMADNLLVDVTFDDAATLTS
jgi:glycine cleavage system regulatory protein